MSPGAILENSSWAARSCEGGSFKVRGGHCDKARMMIHAQQPGGGSAQGDGPPPCRPTRSALRARSLGNRFTITQLTRDQMMDPSGSVLSPGGVRLAAPPPGPLARSRSSVLKPHQRRFLPHHRGEASHSRPLRGCGRLTDGPRTLPKWPRSAGQSRT